MLGPLHLVTRSDFDLPRARDIEQIGAEQIERNFFLSPGFAV